MPAGGAYSTLPKPLAVFKGLISKGMEGKEGRKSGRGGEGCPLKLGSLDTAVEEGVQEGKEVNLVCGVQALLFSTLSTGVWMRPRTCIAVVTGHPRLNAVMECS